MKTFTVITIDNKTGKFGGFKVKAASMPKAKAVAKSIIERTEGKPSRLGLG